MTSCACKQRDCRYFQISALPQEKCTKVKIEKAGKMALIDYCACIFAEAKSEQRSTAKYIHTSFASFCCSTLLGDCFRRNRAMEKS